MRGGVQMIAILFLMACGTDDRPASWAFIHAAIIKPNCATVSCHSDGNAQANIRLHSRQAAYLALVEDDCDAVAPDPTVNRSYVNATAPDSSFLMELLLGDNVKRSMPPDRLLPLADVELIEAWITAGALCD